ncbi:hypothetical protein BDW67DRAFT_25281 [Aspergillus spinulosporus]
MYIYFSYLFFLSHLSKTRPGQPSHLGPYRATRGVGVTWAPLRLYCIRYPSKVSIEYFFSCVISFVPSDDVT